MWSQLLVFFFCFLDFEADSETDWEAADWEAALEADLEAVDTTLPFTGMAVEGVTLGRGGEACCRQGSFSLSKVQH